MNYMVTKNKSDGRPKTCGLWIPDGFSIVVELTHARIKQLENLKKFGYNVDETDEPLGAYDEQGRKVDYHSIYEYYTEDKPMRYEDEVNENAISKEVPFKDPDSTALEDEISMLRMQCERRNIKYSPLAGVGALKKKLANHSAV